MSYSSLPCRNRVELIVKKFETCVTDENKALVQSNVNGRTNCKTNECLKANNIVKLNKVSGISKVEVKTLIKRSPAFRRDKLGSDKKFIKVSGKNFQDSSIDCVVNKSINSYSEKDLTKSLHDYKASQNSVDLSKQAITNSSKGIVSNKPVIQCIGQSNEVFDENVEKPSSNNFSENKEEIIDSKLSETLKRVLKSPLPKGPPPQKPPRTFCHNLECNRSFGAATSTKDIPKLKLKLEKLENVIKTHEDVSNKKFISDKTNVCVSNIEQLSKSVKNIVCSNISCLKTCEEIQSPFSSSDHEVNDNTTKSSKGIEVNLDLSCLKTNSKKIQWGKPCLERETSTIPNSEPIYNLPYRCRTSDTLPKFNGIINKPNRPELHYMCTDVSRIKPEKQFELSSDKRVVKKLENRSFSVHGSLNSVCVASLQVAGNKKGETKAQFESSYKKPNKGLKSFTMISNEGNKESTKHYLPSISKASLYESKGEAENEIIKKILKNVSDEDTLLRKPSEVFKRVPYWKCSDKEGTSRLFECCMLVGLTVESGQSIPYIKMIFPPAVKPPPFIEVFCFPDASQWSQTSDTDQVGEQYYSLFLTNENGGKKFLYCRRVLPEGSPVCLPLTYCIVTKHKANGFFYKILEELESRHGSSEMENFIQQLYEAEFPSPGEGLRLKNILKEADNSFSQTSTDSTYSTLFKRPYDIRLEEMALPQLFNHLNLSLFLKVFGSILEERKILLLSTSLRKLSSCIESLQFILIPFFWQHTYIPVLPLNLTEICEAPTPYIIGLLKSEREQDTSIEIFFENGIMVDLDTNKVVKSCGDEDSILPSILSKPLKTSLSLAVNCTATSEVNYNVLISDAFLNFFVQSCGHYSKFIKTCGDNKFFEEKSFIEYVDSAPVQRFLEKFSKTAMFQTFIKKHLSESFEDITDKLFNLRITEDYKNSKVLSRTHKPINKKVKTLSDKFKDLMQ